jgi:hypothetical protein
MNTKEEDFSTFDVHVLFAPDDSYEIYPTEDQVRDMLRAGAITISEDSTTFGTREVLYTVVEEYVQQFCEGTGPFAFLVNIAPAGDDPIRV